MGDRENILGSERGLRILLLWERTEIFRVYATCLVRFQYWKNSYWNVLRMLDFRFQTGFGSFWWLIFRNVLCGHDSFMGYFLLGTVKSTSLYRIWTEQCLFVMPFLTRSLQMVSAGMEKYQSNQIFYEGWNVRFIFCTKKWLIWARDKY
jgi:hypothetical protein